MDRTAKFYSSPSYVGHGAGMPIFSGSRRQRGGSILGSIKSLVQPTLTSMGKAAINQAVGLAGDVLGDVFRGRTIKQSLTQHGLKRLKNVGTAGLDDVKSRFSTFASSKRSTRKRKATSKVRSAKVPPAKKRRRALF